jgi:hypothetical protein
MSATTVTTSPKNPLASVVLTLDATPQLPAGVTLTTIQSVSIAVAVGYENPPTLAYANDVINTSPIVLGAISIAAYKAVQMQITGGTSGLSYQVTAVVATNNPEITVVLQAVIPVQSSAIAPPSGPTPQVSGYSGTVGETVITVQQLIDEGARRAGKLAEELSVEQVLSAKQSLFLLLANLINQGIQYFAIKKQVIGLNADQFQYTLPAGANDVLNALYRYMQRPTSTNTSSDGQNPANAFDNNVQTWFQQNAPNGWIQADYGINNPQYIGSIGVLPYVAGGGSATWNFNLQASADGVNWTTLQTFTNQTVTDNEWIWADIDPGQNVEFYRIAATNSTTLALRELYFGTFSTEITMSRLNRDDYTNLPNKNYPADQPYQFWFNRTIPVPTIVLWPTPSDPFIQMTVWYSSQIQDVGALSGQLAVPDRWLMWVQTALAHQMSQSLPGVDLKRIMYLEQQAEKYFNMAEVEERDKSPIYFAPNIAVYTR